MLMSCNVSRSWSCHATKIIWNYCLNLPQEKKHEKLSPCFTDMLGYVVYRLGENCWGNVPVWPSRSHAGSHVHATWTRIDTQLLHPPFTVRPGFVNPRFPIAECHTSWYLILFNLGAVTNKMTAPAGACWGNPWAPIPSQSWEWVLGSCCVSVPWLVPWVPVPFGVQRVGSSWPLALGCHHSCTWSCLHWMFFSTTAFSL